MRSLALATALLLAALRSAQAAAFTHTTYSDFATTGTWSGFGSSIAMVSGGEVTLGYGGAELLSVVTSTPMPSLHSNAPIAVWNGRVYIPGGMNPSITNVVHSAPVSADGTIGTWRAETSLAENMRDGALAVWNSRLYLAGGYQDGGSGCLSRSWSSPINADGTLGTWVAETALPVTRNSHPMMAWNGRLYQVGGSNTCNTADTTVYSIAIKADGRMDAAWRTETALPTAFPSPVLALYNGRLYVGSSAAYYSAAINGDGTLGAWASYTAPPVDFNHTAAWNGRIYGGGNDRYDIYSTSISANGTTGQWIKETVAAPVSYYGKMAISDGVMVLPSWETGNAVYSLNLNVSGGAGGSWTTNGTVYPKTTSGQDTVAWKGELYSLGGTFGGVTVSSVVTSAIASDGSVGSWSEITPRNTSGVNFPEGAVVINGWIYSLLGGSGGGAGKFEFARLCSTGTLCSGWTQATPPWGAGYRDSFTVMSSSISIYVIGGEDYSCANVTGGFYATTCSTGTMCSGWTAFNVTGLPGITWKQGGAAYNGYLYNLGGQTSGCPGGCVPQTASVYYALVNANGTVANWTATTALPVTLREMHVEVWDGNMYVMGGMDCNGTAQTTVYRAPINFDGTLGSWTTMTGLPAARNRSNSQSSTKWKGKLYVVGGNATDTVYYSGVSSYSAVGTYFNSMDLGADYTLDSISWNATLNGGTVSVYISTASVGTPTFTPWISVTSGGSLSAPVARYVRYRVDLAPSSSNGAPVLSDLTVNTVAQRPPLVSTPTAASTTGLTVNWSINGNPAGTVYRVQAATEPAYSTITAAADSTADATSQALTGLSANTTYYTRVIPLVSGATSFTTESGYPVSSNSVVGLWHFQEGSGTSAADSSGNGNTGTLVNTPTWITGRFGQTLSFNGSNQYVTVADHASIRLGANNLTISAWINTTADGAILDKSNTSSPYEFYRLWVGSGKLNGAASDCGTGGCGYGSTRNPVAGNTSVNDGKWHFVTLRRTGAKVDLYVDGVLDGTNTDGSAWNTDSSVALSIGSVNGSSSWFNGRIDEVVITSRALSETEIKQSMGSWPGATLVETPTSVVFDEISTGTILASAYAPTPAFSNLDKGASGTDIAIDAAYAAWHLTGNTWTTKAVMTTARSDAAAVSLGGKVYVFGGSNGSDLNVNEEYNPTANAWTTKTVMPTARTEVAGAAVGAKIYGIGGLIGAGRSSANEEYDPVANSWTAKAAMTTPRSTLAAAAVNGKIYAVGGYSGGALNTNEEYSPALNTWATKTVMTSSRYYVAATAARGEVYAMGGYSGGTLDVNEDFNPSLNSWVSKAVLPVAAYGLAAATVGGKIYAIGGNIGSASNANREYDPAANVWATKAVMPTARYQAAGAATGGRIYVVGGVGPLNTNEEYDPGVSTKFTALTPNTLYAFKAKARNVAGVETGETGTISTYTLAAVPGAPAGGASTFTAINGTGFTVNWASGSFSGGYNPLLTTLYLVQLSTKSNFLPVAASSQTSNLFGSFTGLSINTSYYAQVQAINGNNVATAFLSLSSASTAVLPPVISTPTSPTATGLTVNWSNNGNDAATVYRVQAATEPYFNTVTATADSGANATTLALTGLSANTSYYTRVIALVSGATSFTTESGYPVSSQSVVGIWHFSEGSGSAALDSSGKGNTGTLVNSPTWTGGRFGQTLSFNGSNQYVTIPDHASIRLGANNFTISAWINTSADGTILDKSNTGSPYEFYRLWVGSGKLNGAASDCGTGGCGYGSTRNPVAGNALVNDGKWHFVTLRRTGAKVDLYVDGVLDGTNTDGSAWNTDNSISLSIGSVNGSSSWFSGRIDEVTITSRALSEIELKQAMGSWPVATLVQTPTSVVFDEISTGTIVASAYAPTPAFSRLSVGQSGVNVARDGAYAGFRTGDVWTTKAVMTTARANVAAAVVGGKVYFVGGGAGGVNEEYNPATNAWASKTSLPTALPNPVAGAVGNKLYATGGNAPSCPSGTHQEYDPATNAWTAKTSLTTARQVQAGGASLGGFYYAIGGDQCGSNSYFSLTTNERYDPLTNAWTGKTAMTTPSRLGIAVAAGGMVYYLSGQSYAGDTSVPFLTANQQYDPVANSWTAKAVIPTGRWHLGAAVVGGKIYAIGGQSGAQTAGVNSGANEEYDPGNDTWVARAVMPTARYAQAVAAVGGRIYAAGGNNGSDLQTNEEYDPGVSAQFTALTPNTSYAFKAKARNVAGVETGETGTISTYTLAAVPGAPPFGVSTFTAINGTNLTVNWSSGSLSGGYNPLNLTWYLVQLSTKSNFAPVWASSQTYNLDAAFTSLNVRTTYYAQVQAINGNNVATAFLSLSSVAAGSGISSAQDGLWSAPGTWDAGTVPTAIDSVTIRAGHIVTIDVMNAVSSSTIVKGTLKASRAVSSSWTLTSGDLNIAAGGVLDYGTEADPIPTGINAHLVLSSGTTAGQYGLIVGLGGNFSVRGSTKSAFTTAFDNVGSGAVTSFKVDASSAIGWAATDVLAVVKTARSGTDETELVSLEGISISLTTATLTVNKTFTYAHLATTGPIYVANLSRNVVIASSAPLRAAYIQNLARHATGFYVSDGEFSAIGSAVNSKEGIVFMASSTGTIRRASIHDSPSQGINLLTSAGAQVLDSVFYKNPYGIMLNGRTNQLRRNILLSGSLNGFQSNFGGNIINGNVVASYAGHGFQRVNFDATRSNFDGNVVFGNAGSGLYIWDSGAFDLKYNRFYNNSGSGIANCCNPTSNHFISSNTVFLNGSNGIALSGNYSLLEDNVIYRNGGHGIVLAGTPRFGNVIFGGTISSNTSAGVSVTGGNDSVTISSVAIYGNAYGLQVSVSTVYVVSSNLGYDTAGASRSDATAELDFQGMGRIELKRARVNASVLGVNTASLSGFDRSVLSYEQDFDTGTLRVWGDWKVDNSTVTLDWAAQLHASSASLIVDYSATAHTGLVQSVGASAVDETVHIRYDGSQWVVTGSRSGAMGTFTGSQASFVTTGSQVTFSFTLSGGPVAGQEFVFHTTAGSADPSRQKRLLFGPTASTFNAGRSKLSVASTGGIVLRGKTDGTTHTLIDRLDTASTYYTFVDSGAFTAAYSSFTNMDPGGLQLSGSAGVSISSSTFDFLGFASGTNTYITMRDLTSNATFYDLTFGLSRSSFSYASAYNVRVEGADTGLAVVVRGLSSSFLWGEAYDEELSGANKVAWIPATCTGPLSFTFTDPVLTPRVSILRAIHVAELRTSLDTLRSDAGLSAYPWSNAVLTPGLSVVRATHVSELRAALDAVYTACFQTLPNYSDPVITSGATPARAVHISELRSAVQAAK